MTETISAQDARRELADNVERLCQQRAEAQRDNITIVAHFLGRDLANLVGQNQSVILSALRAEPARGAEEMEPSPGLLMSMALRYDHGLGMPGYYDQQIFSLSGAASHAQRLESALGIMRQLWEEVTGNGFYRPKKEAEYAARLARLRALSLPQGNEGGGE